MNSRCNLQSDLGVSFDCAAEMTNDAGPQGRYLAQQFDEARMSFMCSGAERIPAGLAGSSEFWLVVSSADSLR